MQVKCDSRQFREGGQRHVAVPPRGTLEDRPLRYLAFQGEEAPFEGVRFVPHITRLDGHTDGRRDTSMKGGPYPLLRPLVASTARVCPVAVDR